MGVIKKIPILKCNAINSVAHSCLNNIHTDIGWPRTDLFSSAAFRLIVSSFFTNFFIMTGGRKSRQEFAGSNPDFRRTQQPTGGSPFLRQLSLFFHGNSFSRSGRGNHRPSLSVLSSLREHGLSVLSIQFFLVFSGGVRPAAANGIQGVRPSFFRLYEQFFHNTLNWGGPNSGAFTGTFRSFGLFSNSYLPL